MNVGSVKNFRDTDTQALAFVLFTDEGIEADENLQQIDQATGGLIKSVLDTGEFKGKENETAYLVLPAGGELSATRVLLVGAGDKESFGAGAVSQAAGVALRVLRAKNIKSIAFAFRAEGDKDLAALCAASVEGAFIGAFEPDKYRTSDKEERTIEQFTIIVEQADDETVKRAVERGRIIGEATNLTRDIAHEPGAYMTPTILAERAQQVATRYDLEIDVLDNARMESEGMGSLLSVARGTIEPAKLIVIKYTPEGYEHKEGDELLTFVGKGVTFDTGGISIKPAEKMEDMKYDMTGGATVVGMMRAIGELKPSIPVLGVVPSVENMPSGSATKPGDVVRAMSGKTIEVINTDAEGRLILADAITYAKKLGATKIIDLATLTGAVVVALGDVNVGVMGTDQELIDEIIASGQEVGEKLWQLPLDKEYSKQIKSDIADIKNVGGRKAGTITAAAFIKEFADGVSWAHLDIAGTAWTDEAKPYRAKGPTGIAVRTLLNLVERAAR